MKTTKKQLNEMYDFMQNLYSEHSFSDIFLLKERYNDFSEQFGLDIAFGIDGCEYAGDDAIYCYVHVNNIGSIVFERNVERYTDENFYKDAVNHLLELQEQAEKIIEKLEKLEKAD